VLDPSLSVLRSIVDQVREGLVAVDMNNDFILWNPAATDILGYGPIPKNQPEDWSLFYGLYCPKSRSLLTSEEMPLTQAMVHGARFQRDMFVQNDTCPQGRWIEVDARPLYDSAGQQCGALAQFIDITHRRLSDLSRRMMLGLFESSQDGMINVDPEGIILSWNSGAESIFGYSAPEVVGKSSLMMAPDDKVEEMRHVIERLNQGHRYWRSQTFGRHKNGATVEIARSITPIRDSGDRLLGYSTIVTDVTKWRATERELLSSREQLRQLSARLQTAQEQELNRISRELHDELGQLLTGLKMDLAWLDEKLNDSHPDLGLRVTEMNYLLEQTMQSVRRLATQMRPQLLETLGLAPALARLLEQTSTRAGFGCKLTVHPTVEARLHQVSLDALTALYRICQEGLTNASKHAQARHVNVEVTDAGDRLRMFIRDDGGGIDPSTLASTRGLGLVGMRERALLWGGTLEITNSEDGGTQLCVDFPWASMATASEP
jgi:two-component system sensor histidine kinase UhpB